MRRLLHILLLSALSAIAPPDAALRDAPWGALADDDDGDDGGDDDGGDDDGGDDDGGDDDGGDGDAGGAGGGDDGGDDGDGGGSGDGGNDRGGRGGGVGDQDNDDRGDDDDRHDDYGDDGSDDDAAEDGEADDDGAQDAARGRRSMADQFLSDLRDLFGGGEGDNTDAAPREIVGLSLSPAALDTLESRGFRSLSRRTLAGLGDVLHRLAIPDFMTEDGALAVARALAPDAEFDLNHLYRGGGGACDDPACWPFRTVAFPQIGPDACARGAPVAILDTAVNIRHPTLRGARIETRSFVRDDLTGAPADHGTAVAALLVGRVAPGAEPLAPGATLLAADVFALRDGEQIADAEAILAALDWAIARRARVIGMSLAGPENRLVALGVRAAARRANLLAAAGNDGPSAGPAFPAAHPEVAAVAAVDQRRRAWRGGNRGGYVELAAPGVGVLSARAGGGLSEWTGTSFAVPFAVAATLRARAEVGGDPQAARRLLADRARDLGAPGRDPLFGYGLVAAAGGRCW